MDAEAKPRRGAPRRNTSVQPVDYHVGQQVRSQRQAIGLSQAALGKRIGVTFQQIQKYERGDNRISASKLYALSAVLSVPAAFFFEGLPQSAEAIADPASATRRRASYAASAEGARLLVAFMVLPARTRGNVLRLIADLPGGGMVLAEAGGVEPS